MLFSKIIATVAVAIFVATFALSPAQAGQRHSQNDGAFAAGMMFGTMLGIITSMSRDRHHDHRVYRPAPPPYYGPRPMAHPLRPYHYGQPRATHRPGPPPYYGQSWRGHHRGYGQYHRQRNCFTVVTGNGVTRQGTTYSRTKQVCN